MIVNGRYRPANAGRPAELRTFNADTKHRKAWLLYQLKNDLANEEYERNRNTIDCRYGGAWSPECGHPERGSWHGE